MSLRTAPTPTRRPERRPRRGSVVLVLVLAAALVLAGLVAWDPIQRFAAAHGAAGLFPSGEPAVAPPLPRDPTGTAAASGPLGADDGYIAPGGSILPTADLPAITRLDAGLRDAMQRAAADAAADGVTFVITSGWRSTRYQQHLLDAAVRKYGSLEEARRWVATPQTSAHVTGHAVDVGRTDADSWLQQHGRRYGLCQAYANEMWHFELLTTPGGRCPQPRSDAAAG